MSTEQDVHRALLGAAVKLSKMAPQEWGHFLQMLSASAEIDNRRLLASTPDTILHYQGRAVALNELCISLSDAERELHRFQHSDHRANRAPRIDTL